MVSICHFGSREQHNKLSCPYRIEAELLFFPSEKPVQGSNRSRHEGPHKREPKWQNETIASPTIARKLARQGMRGHLGRAVKHGPSTRVEGLASDRQRTRYRIRLRLARQWRGL